MENNSDLVDVVIINEKINKDVNDSSIVLSHKKFKHSDIIFLSITITLILINFISIVAYKKSKHKKEFIGSLILSNVCFLAVIALICLKIKGLIMDCYWPAYPIFCVGLVICFLLWINILKKLKIKFYYYHLIFCCIFHYLQ